MCFKASSNRTSPVGVSDFKMIFLQTKYINFCDNDQSNSKSNSYREHKARLLIPAFSNSTRPRNPSSMRIHPLKPLDMQSFQNDV